MLALNMWLLPIKWNLRILLFRHLNFQFRSWQKYLKYIPWWAGRSLGSHSAAEMSPCNSVLESPLEYYLVYLCFPFHLLVSGLKIFTSLRRQYDKPGSWQTLSAKDQVVNTLDLVGHSSVAATQLCCCSKTAARTHKWMSSAVFQ